MKKLDKLWLDNNPKIIKLKDDFAREVRSMWISLFNEHDDKDNAINFIEEAKNIAHSDSIQHKLKQDIKDMTEQEEKSEVFKSILELHKGWKEYFENKSYQSAEKMFSWCIKLIIDELSEKFNFKKDKLQSLTTKIEASFTLIALWQRTSESVIDNIDKIKKMIQDDWWFSWGDDLEFTGLSVDQRLLLMLLVDATTYRKMSDMIVNKSSYNYWGNSASSGWWIPSWVRWIIVAIIIAIIRGASQ